MTIMSTLATRLATPERLDRFRQAMRRFPSGVTVVTGRVNDRTHGITVSSFCSVSMQPPLVLVCLNNVGRAAEALLSADKFAINILAAGQESVSNACAGPRGEEWLTAATSRVGADEVPVVRGATAALVCTMFNRYPAGDHTIVLGHVDEVILGSDRMPLAYHDGSYVRLPMDPPRSEINQ